MADDSAALTALQDQLAQALAQRDIAQAQLTTLQTQQQMQAAVLDAGKAKAIADAQTSAATQQKAAADAQASVIAAQQAVEKAKWGSVTGSSLAGDVTVNTGGGNAEATLLAARATADVAKKIGSSVETAKKGQAHEVLIFAGAQGVDLSHWRAFRNSSAIVADAFTRADNAKQQADQSAKVVPVEKVAGVEAVGAAITGAGAALDVLSKLGSYFQSNYTISGATVTGVDDDLLAVSVAGVVQQAFYPARWVPLDQGTELLGLMKPLAATRDTAAASLKEVQGKAQKYKDALAKAKDDKAKAQLQSVANAYDRATDAYNAAIKGFDDLSASLAADKNGVPLGVLIVNEKWIGERLQAGAWALFVRLHSAAGANYTKKNLWTFFGGMPFYVMGGGVGSFVLINGGSGAVIAASQFPIHSGYQKVSRVARQFEEQPSASK